MEKATCAASLCMDEETGKRYSSHCATDTIEKIGTENYHTQYTSFNCSVSMKHAELLPDFQQPPFRFTCHTSSSHLSRYDTLSGQGRGGDQGLLLWVAATCSLQHVILD